MTDPLERARAVLSRTPLIDGHNDLPYAMRRRNFYDFAACDIAERRPDLMTDIPRLRAGAMYTLGVRYMTLTHNDNVPWADSATDEPAHGGLTAFGEQIVAEMNRLDMLVDCSHVSAETMAGALRVSEAPVIFSHSSCRAVCDHPRDIPDEVLAKLTRGGGVAMATFVPQFVSQPYAAWHAECTEEVRAHCEDPNDSETWRRVWDEIAPNFERSASRRPTRFSSPAT